MLACCGAAFFTQQSIGAPPELWPFLLGSLTIQPLLLAVVTVGFSSLRQDQFVERTLAICGFSLTMLLTAIYSEASNYAWVLSISPGSSVWSPWASALVLALGAFGIVASIRRFESLEFGRYGALPA